MKWNDHYRLQGKHAFMSASRASWLNYSYDQIKTRYLNEAKKEKGTYLHDLASRLIRERIKVAPLKKAFNQFVNDCIGFRLSSEVLLYYSDNCFGTADGIRFDEKAKTLYVFDLKTGDGKPKPQQLLIYCALFCLEYHKSPKDLTFVCRFYQGYDYDEIIFEASLVDDTMKKIIMLDKSLNELQKEIEDGTVI